MLRPALPHLLPWKACHVLHPSIRRAAIASLHRRSLHASVTARDVPSWPNPPTPQPTVTPYEAADDARSGSSSRGGGVKSSVYAELAASPFVQAGVTTVVGLIMVCVFCVNAAGGL
jgi:hypothetical protein